MNPETGESATSKPIARIYLVRHGETQENRDGIIQGQRDTALNETGQKQALMVGERFREVKIDKAFSSDLRRAVSTAEAILAYHPKVHLEEQKELRERGMGDLEGKEAKPGMKLVVATDPTVETSAAFCARVVSWWNQKILGHVLSRAQNEPMTVLVTTHGGFITTLVRELIGSRKAVCGEGVVVWKCFNTSVTVIEIDERRTTTVVAFGDVRHLDTGNIALHSVQ